MANNDPCPEASPLPVLVNNLELEHSPVGSSTWGSAVSGCFPAPRALLSSSDRRLGKPRVFGLYLKGLLTQSDDVKFPAVKELIRVFHMSNCRYQITVACSKDPFKSNVTVLFLK